MLVVLAILLVLAFFVMSLYNSLASIKVKISEAWSQIDVQLKRRVDLITDFMIKYSLTKDIKV